MIVCCLSVINKCCIFILDHETRLQLCVSQTDTVTATQPNDPTTMIQALTQINSVKGINTESCAHLNPL